jgi:hypothetical protein
MSSNLREQPAQPDQCKKPVDLSTYPKFDGSAESLNTDIRPFLCEALKMSRDPDQDPVVRPGFDMFNISPWMDALTGMKGIGDPRLDLGEMMLKTVEKYKPLLDIKLQIMREGCQIIGEDFCDASGKKIYSLKEVCPEIDPKEEITLENLQKFTYDLFNQRVISLSDNFVKFIKKTYVDTGFKVELISMSNGDMKKIRYAKEAPIFFVKASKKIEKSDVSTINKLIKQLEKNPNTDSSSLLKEIEKYKNTASIKNPLDLNKYYKYFFDSRELVSKGLGIKITFKAVKEFRRFDDDDFIDAMSGPIWPELADDVVEEIPVDSRFMDAYRTASAPFKPIPLPTVYPASPLVKPNQEYL